ncbi:winged helix-turn-helix domain-containing protein [Entomohabitans teleogrylli]|uniref:winged helix-turn-helix domain-containing protein n=1 Tax=Entomohabitans teleogrylli TaxID=1384589 RepID=UPI00073D7664|nr:winged helix-turn-helix domain-containing protein [Entomohabitans teleogrylli]
MPAIKLTLRHARNLHLAAQGLLRPPRRAALREDIPAAVARMSLLQIDTINIVARSPYLVLFSRLGNYSPQWLDDALAAGELFEYWAHEACFLPRQDYALVRNQMLHPEALGWKYRAEWMAQHAAEIDQLLLHIRENGPVRSADFEHPEKGASGWWQWKPHKQYLEGLFTAGKVMVAERRNFQRIYDLTERVMPEWDDELHLLSDEQARERMLRNSAASLGIFRPGWLADYYRLRHVDIKSRLPRWQEEGIVIPVEVQHLGEMWLHHSLLPQLEAALSDKLNATRTCVLSPFDPVVWDRRRAEQLFNFSYRLECYTPAPKRQYGYFVLPLLHRGELAGRMDAKMHRKTGELEVISVWLEENQRSTPRLADALMGAIGDFGRWQGATVIRCGRLPQSLAALWGEGWEIAR